jgi:hypothetical protein
MEGTENPSPWTLVRLAWRRTVVITWLVPPIQESMIADKILRDTFAQKIVAFSFRKLFVGRDLEAPSTTSCGMAVDWICIAGFWTKEPAQPDAANANATVARVSPRIDTKHRLSRQPRLPRSRYVRTPHASDCPVARAHAAWSSG